jgi:hypothetical protein
MLMDFEVIAYFFMRIHIRHYDKYLKKYKSMINKGLLHKLSPNGRCLIRTEKLYSASYTDPFHINIVIFRKSHTK